MLSRCADRGSCHYLKLVNIPKTFPFLKTDELDFCLVVRVRQFTLLYIISAVLAHFNLGVVPMNNNPYLLVSFSLFGPCYLVQVVRLKAHLHYDEHESFLSIYMLSRCADKAGEHSLLFRKQMELRFCLVVRVVISRLYTLIRPFSGTI